MSALVDCHEEGNVGGIAALHAMSRDVEDLPFHAFIGVPSCVPEGPYCTSGATLGLREVAELLRDPRFTFLAEVMNFPGVISGDPVVLGKTALAKHHNKPIDGHAPGIGFDDATTYFRAGILSDHECISADEADCKFRAGMKLLLIRNGSVAKNFDALLPVWQKPENWDRVALCSDDVECRDLISNPPIYDMLARGIEAGIPVLQALKATSLNIEKHYGFPIPLLRVGDKATFILSEDETSLRPYQLFVDGDLVAENGRPLVSFTPTPEVNNFSAQPIGPQDIQVPIAGEYVRVIEVIDGQIVTRELIVPTNTLPAQSVNRKGVLLGDPDQDILKIVVVDRYDPTARCQVGFVRGFGLKDGAIAMSVQHDAHHVIAVGSSDVLILEAVNRVIGLRGAIVVQERHDRTELPLPVFGLMSNLPGAEVAAIQDQLHAACRRCGSDLLAPITALSFMGLGCIPELKLSNLGLVRNSGELVSLFTNVAHERVS